jgi:hypothetical protein
VGRFRYYDQLRPAEREIYRRSDQVVAIELDEPERLLPRVAALEAALASSERPRVEAAAQSLIDALTDALAVPPVDVEVLEARPRSSASELHGLYTVPADGERPTIQVWMRSAVRQRVVAPRTFLRTLLHEICHHFDYELLGLPDSLHTEGFFKRESSLVRQLLPSAPAGGARGTGEAESSAPDPEEQGSR